MNNTIQFNGQNISAGGNSPVLLNQKNLFYQVKSGEVDIFAVKFSDGVSVGKRKFILSAGAGDIILNIESTSNLGFIAAGLPGSELVKVAESEFDKTAGAAMLAEKWTKSLSDGISSGITPKRVQKLSCTSAVALEKDAVIMPAEDLLWIQVKKGELCYYSDEMLTVSAGSIVPFTSSLWITILEDCELRILNTADYLAEKGFKNAFDTFHKISVDAVIESLKKWTKSDVQRVALKKERDSRTFSNALNSLRAIVEPEFLEEAETTGDDALFNTAVIIGRFLGIKMTAPPERARNSRDPLNEIMKYSRVRRRQILLSGKWWKNDSGPILAYIEETGEPVALIPKNPGAYDLVCPKTGKHTKITEEIAETLKPIAYTLYRPFPEKALNAWDIMKFGINSSWKSDLIFIAILGVVSGLLNLVIPIATGKVFDTIIPEAARTQMLQLSIGLVVFAFAGFMFKLTQGIAMLRIEGKMDGSIQAAVWDRLLSLPVPFFRKYNAGDMSNRAMGINMIRRALSGTAMGALLAGVFSVFNLLLLFYYDKSLAVWAFLLVIIAVVITAACGLARLKYERLLIEIEGKISGLVLQLIGGVAKFQIAGAEKRAFGVWANQFQTQKKIDFKARTVSNIIDTFNSIYPVMCSMFIFYMVMMQAKQSAEAAAKTGQAAVMLTTGQFLAFNASFSAFLVALTSVSETLIDVLNVIPLYERAKPILSATPEVDDAKADPGDLCGTIEVKHACFRYDENGPEILKDVSVEIKEGEFVAIVGSSGSGKSTLLRVLLGFEKLSSGAVYYDGQDSGTLNIQSLRQQIGAVLQSGRVTSGSVFTNIVGSFNLGIDDAWEAARMAGLDADIEQMPMGMHTVVSEGGGTLSGGQRQRLLIARAIVNKPRIIFFDEATSALDNKTQATVSKSLDSLKATRVVIAHRLSTIINADKIYVLEKGVVVEHGSYQELMEKDGYFAELAKRQMA